MYNSLRGGHGNRFDHFRVPVRTDFSATVMFERSAQITSCRGAACKRNDSGRCARRPNTVTNTCDGCSVRRRRRRSNVIVVVVIESSEHGVNIALSMSRTRVITRGRAHTEGAHARARSTTGTYDAIDYYSSASVIDSPSFFPSTVIVFPFSVFPFFFFPFVPPLPAHANVFASSSSLGRAPQPATLRARRLESSGARRVRVLCAFAFCAFRTCARSVRVPP